MYPIFAKEIIERCGCDLTTDPCLVISRSAPAGPGDDSSGLPESLVWIDDLETAADLDSHLNARCAIALVFAQLEHMTRESAVHLLGRLRDRHADRVLVDDRTGVFSESELLALGYVALQEPGATMRLFLHDPAEFFSQRAWNTPEDWANPENFRRYRW